MRPWRPLLAMLAFGLLLGAGAAVAAIYLSGDSDPEQAQSKAVAPVQTSAAPSPTPVRCDERTSAERVRRSVVRIQTATSVGTGIVVAADGLVITNAHVVGTARIATLTFSSGAVRAGAVLASDEARDLALISIDAAGLSLTPLTWGNEQALRPASRLLAWGYALDLPGEPSLTTGAFSGLRTYRSVVNVVQTDVPLNTGNSGGPLFNECGEVVAVVSFGIRGTEGLNFGISATDAREYVRRAPSASSGGNRAPARPEDAVLLFYSLLDQRNFEAAYALLSSAYRARASLDTFRAGYATTVGVYVESVQPMVGASNAVDVTVRATDSIQGRTVVQRYTGSWMVVMEGGSWKLDTARIQAVPATQAGLIPTPRPQAAVMPTATAAVALVRTPTSSPEFLPPTANLPSRTPTKSPSQLSCVSASVRGSWNARATCGFGSLFMFEVLVDVPRGADVSRLEVRVTAPGEVLYTSSGKYPIDGLTTRFNYPLDFVLAPDLRPGTYVIEVRNGLSTLASGTVVIR